MPDPFATALAVLFRAAGAVTADYLVLDSGEELTIQVVWAQGSRDGGAHGDRFVSDVNSFDIRRIDVAMPARGDEITVADPITGAPKMFTLNGAPVLDVEGITWTCPAQPADGA